MPPPSPSRHAHPFFGGAHPRAMAHRGWHRGPGAPHENTLAAFERAVAGGFDYVETDARVTVDGVAVLHHDATVRGPSGATYPLDALPHSEVVGVAGWVPELEEVLRALPRTRFNIDVKTDGAVEAVLTVLERTGAVHRVCLAAFSGARLARLRASGPPGLLTSLGPRSVAALRVRSLLPVGLSGVWTSPGPAQVPPGPPMAPLIDRRLLRRAHREGREVHAWTVDDADVMEHLLDLGVDGLITDEPGRLREVLDRRGRWASRRDDGER